MPMVSLRPVLMSFASALALIVSPVAVLAQDAPPAEPPVVGSSEPILMVSAAQAAPLKSMVAAMSDKGAFMRSPLVVRAGAEIGLWQV